MTGSILDHPTPTASRASDAAAEQAQRHAVRPRMAQHRFGRHQPAHACKRRCHPALQMLAAHALDRQQAHDEPLVVTQLLAQVAQQHGRRVPGGRVGDGVVPQHVLEREDPSRSQQPDAVLGVLGVSLRVGVDVHEVVDGPDVWFVLDPAGAR